MKFVDKKYINSLKTFLHKRAEKRRDIIKRSGDSLHLSKRVIFDLHRGNTKEAREKLKQSLQILKSLHTAYKKDGNMLQEGSLKAAQEEFVEAQLFMNFIDNKKVSKVANLNIEEGVFLAGLCDLPGELYRYAIKAATNKDETMVKKCAEASNEIIGELIEFDLTSYLRNKFDQAKQANSKIEKVVYDISLQR